MQRLLLCVTCFTTTMGGHGAYRSRFISLLRGDLGEIAEIKGDMTIKLVHPPGEELKFVVELPGEKQMIFTVDRHQIVDLAESLKLTRN